MLIWQIAILVIMLVWFIVACLMRRLTISIIGLLLTGLAVYAFSSIADDTLKTTVTAVTVVIGLAHAVVIAVGVRSF
jgi:hypothetical protein